MFKTNLLSFLKFSLLRVQESQKYKNNFPKKFWISSQRTMLHTTCSYSPVRLAYRIFEPKGADGKLSPLIFQHGVIASKETWGVIPRILADRTKRKAYTLDTRNHGDSEWSDSITIDKLSEDLLHFMKDKGIPKCIFIGHSMGGASGLRAVLKKPDMFEMVFIEDSYVRSPSQKTFDMIKEFIKMTERILTEIPPHTSESDAYMLLKESMLKHMPEDVSGIVTRHSKITLPFAVKRGSDGRYVLKADVKRILTFCSPFCDPSPEDFYERPSYFIYGTKSPFKINEDEAHIKKHFRNAKLIPLEGASHYIHLNFPEEFTRAVLERLLELQSK